MVEKYDDFVHVRTDIYEEMPMQKGLAEVTYSALGLGGEAGEVVDEVKKLWRKGNGGTWETLPLAMEASDVAYYLTRLAKALGFTLEQLLEINMVKLHYRDAHGKDKIGELAAVQKYLKDHK